MTQIVVRVAAAMALGSMVAQGVLVPKSAGASGAEVGGGGSEYHLRNSLTGGSADVSFKFGGSLDSTLVGDWDGVGGDSLGVHRDNVFMLRQTLSGGSADLTFRYGGQTTEGMAGDWDGDGVDTIGVRDGNRFHLRNTLSGGPADLSFAYGGASQDVLVGDWDGDGADTIGVRDGNRFHLRNTLSGGPADLSFAYGGASQDVLVGDWDGDGADTIGVRDGNRFHLRNSLTGGWADFSFTFGVTADIPLAGDWDGDGLDTVGVRRGAGEPAPVDCSRLACVALTFDDGPSAHTDRLLTTLETMAVPATFFLVGQQVAARPTTARRAQAVGMQVENHTWDHPELPLLTRDGQLEQVRRADDAFAAAGLSRSHHLRPPYGSWDPNTRTLGKGLILWSVDPRDWDGRTSAQIRAHIATNVRAGDIVLMHDTVVSTVDAVPGIVADLRAAGYTLVTVDTLVPGIEVGDVIYSRGRVVDVTQQLAPDRAILRAPDGTELGPVVDQAPYSYVPQG